MKQYIKYALMLALVAIIASPLSAQDDKKKGKKGKKPAPGAQILAKLEKAGVEVSDEQKKKIGDAYKQLNTKAASLRKEVAAVLKERQAVQKKLAASGKKGKELREAVMKELDLNDDQKAKLTELQGLQSAAVKEVCEIVGEEAAKKAGLLRGAKKPGAKKPGAKKPGAKKKKKDAAEAK